MLYVHIWLQCIDSIGARVIRLAPKLLHKARLFPSSHLWHLLLKSAAHASLSRLGFSLEVASNASKMAPVTTLYRPWHTIWGEGEEPGMSGPVLIEAVQIVI